EAVDAARGSALLAAGGAVGYAAFLVLCFALVFGLATTLPAWAAGLIVGVVLAAGSAVLFAVGRRKVKELRFRPQEALGELGESREWARETMQSARSVRRANA
ncbi:MAG: phage holin family protein, partial [Deltaproteobacteria bacterium]|nr:phage holin family protein [Deltaproteobacteria bacterium]